MKNMRRWISVCLAALAAVLLASCGGHENPKNLLPVEQEKKQVVNLFSPMEKSDPNAENVARTAADLTVAMAEEKLGVSVNYWTYTAEDYQDKTYD